MPRPDGCSTSSPIDGADLLAEVVDAIAAGTATATPQEGEPTFAPKLGIDDARLDWTAPADVVARSVPRRDARARRVDDPRRPAAQGARARRGIRIRAARAGRRCELDGRRLLVGTGTEPLELRARAAGRAHGDGRGRLVARRRPRRRGGAMSGPTAGAPAQGVATGAVGAPQTRPAGDERISPARLVAFEVLEAVRDDEAYANLLLPSRIRRARTRPSGCRVRDRAHLRHAAHAGLLRRGHRPRRRPPHQRDRPGRARRAPDRHPPAPRHPGAHARRGLRAGRDREAGGAEGRRLRQRGAAHDLPIVARGLARPRGRGGEGRRRPARPAREPSPLDRPRPAGRTPARGARRRARPSCSRPTTPRRA